MITAAKFGLSTVAQKASSKLPTKTGSYTNAVLRAAQASPFGGERGPSGRGRAGDDQDLEVGTMCIRAPERRRQHVRAHGVLVLVLRPLAGILAVPAGQQRAQDAAGELRDRVRIAFVVA